MATLDAEIATARYLKDRKLRSQALIGLELLKTQIDACDTDHELVYDSLLGSVAVKFAIHNEGHLFVNFENSDFPRLAKLAAESATIPEDKLLTTEQFFEELEKRTNKN